MHNLLPIGVATEFLGVKQREWRRLMEEDGLPVVQIPAETRPSPKIHPRMLWLWLKKQTVGEFLTYPDFLEDLNSFLAARKTASGN